MGHAPSNGRRLSRRDILRGGALGAASTWTVPSFLGNAFFGHGAAAQDLPLGGGDDSPIVVVVQQGGGNDSLNTVIPFTGTESSIYYRDRPSLAIPPELVLPLAGGLGLHPTLTSLKSLWDEEELAVVNGVGYPNPNLSHFTSFDFWHTGDPGNTNASTGWLGRFFDHQCAGVGGGCAPTVGLNLDLPSGLAFQTVTGGESATVPSLSSFRWKDVLPFRERLDTSNQETFRRLLGIGSPGGADVSQSDDVLAYVQRSTHNAVLGAGMVEAAEGVAGAAGFPNVPFPETKLGRDLEDVSRMIAGGLPTLVYYVDQSGYDTHARQYEDDGNGHPVNGRHAGLLAELDGAIGAFVAEMKAQGNWERVLLFTFSEFGRKVKENGSSGTDHGAALSLFVTGGGVNAGMFGDFPSLSAPRVKNDSLAYNVDFRRVYRTVLENWLGVSSAAIPNILPAPSSGSFATLPFV